MSSIGVAGIERVADFATVAGKPGAA